MTTDLLYSEDDASFTYHDHADDDDDESDFMDDENIAPNVKRGVGKSSSKKSSNGSSKSSSGSSSGKVKKLSISESNPKGKKKTVEEMYQKKTQLEHILLRPDTYVGSVEPDTRSMFIIKEGGDGSSSSIVQKNITYTPGLFKIYDEILVNAADNAQRDLQMDKLEVTIDQSSTLISVLNNGKGIPIQMHKEHKMYIPTMIFGHLLTSSNYDDAERKTTGGRNGYGAKLANIFSTEFVVECVDTESGLHFRQVWNDNMSICREPKVRKLKASEQKKGDYVKISFIPDLQKFGMTELDNDTVGLLQRRAVDIAGSLGGIRPEGAKKLSVYLNETKIPVKAFKEYLTLYPHLNSSKDILVYEKNERWEVAVSVSDGAFSSISFVNGINTSKGGTHVNYIVDQITAHLCKILTKKHKSTIKPAQVKNHLYVACNCLIVNPAFDSQTKETLTTKAKAFGSEFKFSDKALKSLEKGDLAEAILSFATIKQKNDLKKKSGVKKVRLQINKLDDANLAGGAKSKDCTLILTEGDSAKSLAMSGLSIVGRDYYGVFPLKGKPLNVREATIKQVTANDELKNIVDIIGLKFGTEYNETNIKTLRYGHLMIMADQDHDGSHIKGLIINFLHFFWPSLLEVSGFLKCFITPIVKCTNKRKKKDVVTFFNIPQYESWRNNLGANVKNYDIKYYKGLGTSTSAEAKEYFSNLDIHEVHFSSLSSDAADQLDLSMFSHDEADVNLLSSLSGGELIDMAFSKKRVEERKTWLNAYRENTYLSYDTESIRYSNFINKELILFSRADNIRSLPNVFDGFKPSQRKVLFGCIKKNLKSEVKVAQLVGYIGEHSAYHHGEASLQGTIINMAQNFVGANNINLLTPSGQFGTRRMGGKDAASPRYIFTTLEKITRKIFHPDDDALLNYLQDDGLSIEPEYYVPIIPMLLVNGSEGIGTGWSTNIPNYNPRDIIETLRRLIRGEEIEDIHPWYHGYTGDITMKSAGSYDIKGKIEKVDDITLHITELPLKKWTQDYKQFLEEKEQGDTKKGSQPEIKEFRENHTDTTVSFTISLQSAEKMAEFEKEKNGGLYSKFKLQGKITTTNMLAFNHEGAIQKFDSPADIIRTFYDVRLDFYVRRKAMLLQKLRRQERMLSNKARFVLAVCEGELVVSNRKKVELLNELKEEGYELFNKDESEESSDDDDTDGNDLATGYSYLLNMKLWSLTYEKVEELKSELAETQEKVRELEETSEKQIWLNDLADLEDAIDERDADMNAAEREEIQARKKNSKRQAKNAKKLVSKKKKKDGWDSDLSESSDEELELDSESDDEIVKKPIKKEVHKKRSAPVAKSAPTLTTKKSSEPKAKRAPISKPIVTKKVSEISKPVDKVSLELSSDDEEEDENLSLFERMNKKKKAFGSTRDSRGRKIEGTAAVLNVDISNGTSFAKKRGSPKNDDLSDDEDDFFSAKVKVSKKPRGSVLTKAEKTAGSPLRKKKAQSQSQSSSAIDIDSDLEFSVEVTAPKKIAQRKAPAKKAGVAKKKASKSTKKAIPLIELSDGESEYDSAQEEPAPRAVSSRRTGRAKVDYTEMNGGKESDDEPSFDDDSEDDFEFDE